MSRILVLGDSVMKGVVFDSLKKRYQLLKDSVTSRFMRATKLDVTNCAVFGATINKGEQQFLRRKDTLDEYTYALLEFGGNDCDFDWQAIAQNPEGHHLPNTTIDEFIARYEALIDDLRARHITPALMSLPPLDADRFFATISQGLDADAILRWLGGYKDTIYRWHESYNMAVMKMSREKNVPVIDVRSRFLVRRDYRDLLCDDGMHPNEKGHQLILKIILDFIRPLNLSPVLR
ncbi:MAG TPA: SGNH/GDSL hydrolase family protein [Fastidiosipila sp.]|nr:SGNH/GDSL hydrolase family protein [Fastidiosipila sp.]